MNWKQNEKQFKVGDKIVEKTWLGTHTYEVYRVTKTQAIIRVNEHCDGKYKINYSVTDLGNGRKFYSVHPIPRIAWNTTEYEVIEK